MSTAYDIPQEDYDTIQVELAVHSVTLGYESGDRNLIFDTDLDTLEGLGLIEIVTLPTGEKETETIRRDYLFNKLFSMTASVYLTPYDIGATEYLKIQLKEHLGKYRWLKEIGGTSLQGLPIKTDDRSKTLIEGKYIRVKDEDPAGTFSAKVGDIFLTLTNAQMVAIFLEVEAHVQRCFDSEKAILDKIDDETLTSLDEVYSEFDTQYDSL